MEKKRVLNIKKKTKKEIERIQEKPSELEDRQRKPNLTFQKESSKAKQSDETEQILKTVTQEHFPEVEKYLKLYT